MPKSATAPMRREAMAFLLLDATPSVRVPDYSSVRMSKVSARGIRENRTNVGIFRAFGGFVRGR